MLFSLKKKKKDYSSSPFNLDIQQILLERFKKNEHYDLIKKKIIYKKQYHEITLKIDGHYVSVSDLKFLNYSHCTNYPPLISVDKMGQLRLWNIYENIENKKIKSTFQISAHEKSINSLSICPTNSTFLTCSDDKSIKLWDSNLLSNQNNNIIQTFIDHTSFVQDVSFDETGEIISSAGLDGSIRLWNKNSKNPIFIFQTPKSIFSVTFIPGEFHMLLTSGEAGVCIWDIRKNKSFLEMMKNYETSEIKNKSIWSPHNYLAKIDNSITNNNIFSGLWSIDSWFNDTCINYLLEKNTETNFDEPLTQFIEKNIQKKEIFNKFTKLYEKPFTSHNKQSIIYNVLITKDRQHIITSATDNRHKVWDFYSQKGLWTLKKMGIDISQHKTKPVLSPDNKLLMCGSSDGKIRIWNIFHKNCLSRSEGNNVQVIMAHSFPITSNCFNHDMTAIASGDTSGTIKVRFPFE